MTKDKRRSSPRGLIESVIPAKPSGEQLRPQSASELLSVWREFARGIIKHSGKNPDDYRSMAESEILDHICTAAELLKQLDRVESRIGLAKRDPKRFGDAALYEALLLPSYVHQLTVADNEKHISKSEGQDKTLVENGKKSSEKAEKRNARYRARAEELWKLHPKWEQSASEAAKAIEREDVAKGKSTVVWNTIRRKIRKKIVVTDVR